MEWAGRDLWGERGVSMGSPKVRTGSSRRRRAGALRCGRFCYRLLYVMSFLAATYVVLAHLRSASPISTSGTVFLPVLGSLWFASFFSYLTDLVSLRSIQDRSVQFSGDSNGSTFTRIRTRVSPQLGIFSSRMWMFNVDLRLVTLKREWWVAGLKIRCWCGSLAKNFLVVLVLSVHVFELTGVCS